MTFAEAALFLAATNIEDKQPATWADLGCGNGLFSRVLSSRLFDDSLVYAMDKRGQPAIESINKKVSIQFLKADFVYDDLPLQNLDGILMANALHYVNDKAALLRKLKQYLLPDGSFIIIEYDNAKPNRWVPYPVSFPQLTDLFKTAGYHNIKKTGERASIYQPGKMYVCSVKP